MTQAIRFDEILEMVEMLSKEEQEDLINIVRHRQIERRRIEIAANIDQARKDYQSGEVFRGTTAEVIGEVY